MQHERRAHRTAAAPNRIYPAYCFAASPTYNKWVKLTAADVHGLESYPAFEGQKIFFHLNHPIRYVYLAGLILDIVSIKDKYTLLTLDDGSGVTIEVKITHDVPNGKPRPPRLGEDTSNNDDDDHSNTDEAFFDPESHNPALATRTFETETHGLTVTHNPPASLSDPITLMLEPSHALTVGSLLKAKGTLCKYRHTFQLTLLRATPLLSLDADVAVWEDYAQFCEEVLCKPWLLAPHEIKSLELQRDEKIRVMEEVARRKRAEESKILEKRKRHDELRRRHQEKQEARLEAQRKLLDGNPLDRPKPALAAPPTFSRPVVRHRPQPPVLKSTTTARSLQNPQQLPVLPHPRISELTGRVHVPRPPKLAASAWKPKLPEPG